MDKSTGDGVSAIDCWSVPLVPGALIIPAVLLRRVLARAAGVEVEEVEVDADPLLRLECCCRIAV